MYKENNLTDWNVIKQSIWQKLNIYTKSVTLMTQLTNCL